MNNLEKLSKNLIGNFMKQHGLQKKPSVEFAEDIENSKLDLGKTAYYEPDSMKITIYITGRHTKDTLRSLAHELVHHMQNCRGDLSAAHGKTEEGYAQKNDHLREMEREAYERGNMFFRDWEDNLKSGNYQLYETIYKRSNFKGENFMSTRDWKNQELNSLLMEKWGYANPKKEELNEEVDSYMDLKADYKTLQKELPEDETSEEEEELEEAHPSDVDSRVKGLEDLEEESLKKSVLEMINELLSEENDV